MGGSAGLKMSQNGRFEIGCAKKGRHRVESGSAEVLSGLDLILHAITFTFDQNGLGVMEQAVQ